MNRLERKKLVAEIRELNAPWWYKTFSWSTLLGFGTLVAVAYSPLVQAEKALVEAKKVELDNLNLKFDTKQNEFNEKASKFWGSAERFDHMNNICSKGGGIEIWNDHDGELAFKITISRPFVRNSLYTSVSGVGTTEYTEDLANSIIKLQNVRELKLIAFDCRPKQLGDMVALLPNLERLETNLNNQNATRLIDGLLNCKKIYFLAINSANISVDEAKRLKLLPDLNLLSLQSARLLSDDVVDVFIDFPSLRELSLIDTAVSIEGRRRLADAGIAVADEQGNLIPFTPAKRNL